MLLGHLVQPFVGRLILDPDHFIHGCCPHLPTCTYCPRSLYAQRARTSGSADTLAAELAADAKVAEAMALLEAAERRRVGVADDMDQGIEDGRGQGEGVRGAGQEGSRAGAAIGAKGQGTVGADEWAPPQDQTGDGRTALNQRFGY